jgi:imidazolonepropionase-like amidohydrolase
MNIKKMKIFSQILTAIIFMTSAAISQIPAPLQTQPVALVGGTIHTAAGPVVENGTILFDKGKIVRIGKNIDLPANTQKIQVSGKHIYPSMIDSASTLGLVEISSSRQTIDYAEMGNFNPNVKAEVAINPESELIPVTRSNGIALAVSAPTGGVIAGKAALLMLDGWTFENMVLKAPVGMMMNWPALRGGRYFRMSETMLLQQKKRLEKQFEDLDKFISNSRAYKKAKESSGLKNVPVHKFDPRLDAMIPVLERKLPLIISVNSIKDILAAVNWSESENLKIIILGGQESYLAADILKSKNIPVILRPILTNPSHRDSDFDEPFTTPKKFYEAGVKYCITGGGASNVYNLPYNAAKAASYGLSKDEALKSITLYPAEILDVSDRVGSLEEGKDATLFVSDGDPLEITSNVEMMFIQGRQIDLQNKHKRLYEKYKKRYEQTKSR